MNNFYYSVLGFVIGDALGVPVEFKIRDDYQITDMIGNGSWRQPAGTWSDDSSMVIATLESMTRLKKINLNDIMDNFCSWYFNNKFTAHDVVFDAGRTTKEAIKRYNSGTSLSRCGGRAELDNGNGSLMRILPIALMNTNIKEKMLNVKEVSSLTHAHEISMFGCYIYAAVVDNILKGMDKINAVKEAYKYIERKYAKRLFYYSEYFKCYHRIPYIETLTREGIKSGGYVVDSLEATLWCFLNTDNYIDCVLTAVNLGGDTDTIGALAGGLAGLLYKNDKDTGIPEKWMNGIAKSNQIKELCKCADKLFC